MIGPESEKAGTIRYGMAAVAAASQAVFLGPLFKSTKALESQRQLIMRREPMF